MTSDAAKARSVADGGADDRHPQAAFANYLTTLEPAFLENYSRFGARSQRVVAEALLRELVLAPPDDRKILGMRIVEEYLDAVGGIMALHAAFLRRDRAPLLATFLAHRLNVGSIAAFSAQVAARLPEHILRDLGLPTGDDVEALRPEVSKTEYRQLRAAVESVPQGLTRAARAEQSVLLQLAEGLRKSSTLTNTLDWLPDRSMPPDQVALMVLEEKRYRLATHSLTINEQQLEQFVLAIGTISQAERDMCWLSLRAHDS